MTTNILRFTLIGAMALGLVYAQTDAARLAGTVTDTSGAVIPGASITVTNERTGQSRKVQTNENGQYLVTPLPPSQYTVTAESKGMSNAEFKGLTLQVGQERTLNIPMQPSAV